MSTIENPGRRRFLQTAAVVGGALVIGFHLPQGGRRALSADSGKPFVPNAFLRIGSDDSVTVLVKHAEMGQGVSTALPMLVAEDLEADWNTIQFEFAPVDPAYNHTVYGIQMTGGSTSIANSYEQMRKAGAAAKAMLLEAAAETWSVPATECRAEKGVILHEKSERSARYGELAEKAAQLPPPAEVTLKDPKDFKFVGTPVKRLDARSKVTGSPIYGLDATLPGASTAVVARAPSFGAKLKSFDAVAAKAVPGVEQVLEVPSGVAVVADTFWSAQKGREALKTEWEGGETRSSADLSAEYQELATKPGAVAHTAGDAEKALADAAKTVEAEFSVPYLAHAAMEPLNCLVRIQDGQCDIWTGTQFQTMDRMVAAQVAELPPEQVFIHTQMLGGGFGRRANKDSDFVREAVAVCKAVGGGPVKTVWTREDDMRGGYYRPMYLHKVRAGIDAEGNATAWHHRIVGQSIAAGTAFEEAMVKDGVDVTSVEGVADLAYAVPNLHVEYHKTENPVPVLWWRSVGHSHTAFATESIVDELAHLAGQNPVAYRLALLKDKPRHRGVLELAAKKAGCVKPLESKDGIRRGRGVAVHESFHSFAAEVVEVSVRPNGHFKVDRVVCAIDCGRVVNPDTVAAQMESAIAFGLAAVLHSELTLKDGMVEQDNFNAYQVLRMSEMPVVEVHIVASEAEPTGVGEPGTPPIAPAVANALFAATGKRVRRLPVETDELKA